MTGKRPSELFGWLGARGFIRVVARICLAGLILSLLAPIGWAAFASAPGDAAAAPSCHEVMPESPAPAAPASHDAQGLIPHCPLCVLFGGTSWAPPISAPVTIAVGAVVTTTVLAVFDTFDAPRRLTLRPSPRAPPSSI
jgi:hypothetical protein